MDRHRGGSSTPSYKEAMANKGKMPPEKGKDDVEEGRKNKEEELESTKSKEKDGTKEKEENDKIQGTKDKNQKSQCKPIAEITPRVVLNDPVLQEHRDHMQTYAIICKFMGLWPTEKALQTWIRYHWKPKGSIDLHLGSKGFFTVVFTNIRDKDRVFEGEPYSYIAAGLYMWPWMMNFLPERETFTSVLVWVRLCSLPLDYWQTESLAAIGNKLGWFIKASKATRRGKYTSFARICMEMDLSRALMDEVLLEVFDQEWVQTVNYEHIPFRYRRCREHGHLLREFPLSKVENKRKINTMKDTVSFTK